MQDSLNIIQASVDNCPDEFWSLDKDLRLTFFNKSFEQNLLTFLGIQAVIGLDICQSFRDIGLDSISEYYDNLYRRVLAGENFKLEANTPVEGGIVYRKQYFAPIIVEGQIVGVSVNSRDITDRVVQQKELADRLVQEENLNAKLLSREKELSQSEQSLKTANSKLQETLSAVYEKQSIIENAQKYAKMGIFTQDLSSGDFDFSESILEINKIPTGTHITVDVLTKGIAEQYMTSLREAMETLIKTGGPFELDFPKTLLDGDLVWQRLVALAVDQNEKPNSKIIGFVFNITDFKKTQKSLVLSEMKFKTVSELSTDGIYDWQIDTNLSLWNEGTYELYEFDPANTFTFNDWESMIHSEDKDSVLNSLNSAIQDVNVSVWTYEYRIITGKGNIRYVSDTGKFLRYNDGTAYRMIGAMRDLTAIKQYEASLKEAIELEKKLNEELASREEELASSEEELLQLNENLRNSLENLRKREFLLNEAEKAANMGNWEINLETGRGVWSPNMFKIFGEEEFKESVSMNYMLSFFSGKEYESLVHAINECKNLGRAFHLELEAILPGNIKKWYQVSGASVFMKDTESGKEGGMVVGAIRGIIQDISHYKEVENRLRRSL